MSARLSTTASGILDSRVRGDDGQALLKVGKCHIQVDVVLVGERCPGVDGLMPAGVYAMTAPPSTLRHWPVMFRASSDARNATALPMSSGV